MKPKPSLRLAIIMFVAVGATYFIESTRKTDNLHYKTFSPVQYDQDNVALSNNDFIFFESISKYLLISLSR